jgi:Glycosyltransferase like family/Glycosyltransferase family 17
MPKRRIDRPRSPKARGAREGEDARGGSSPGESVVRAAGATPLSFVVCVNDAAVLNANLLASPCLGADSLHEVIAIRGAVSAAAGLNLGLERAKHELVVCLHQDVYLPEGWDKELVAQYRLAEETLGPVGVAGVYGVGAAIESPAGTLSAERIGWVRDRGSELHEGADFPKAAATLDELLLVLPRGTALRFDPELGFHLYGADICLQARGQGLAVAVLGAFCHHNSRSVGLPQAFFPSASRFARKWTASLPVATPCVVFDADGKIFLLGNTPTGAEAARAEMEVTSETAKTPGAARQSIAACWDQTRWGRELARRVDKPLVIDAFTYWNEAEMLAFRLRILAPVVDKFVIVESDRTFAGHEKPYYSCA